MRLGETERARELVDEMEDVYDELITFDFPDALMSNLRRNVDALRAVLERTQSDLAVTGTQQELIEELRKARSR
jgi:translin